MADSLICTNHSEPKQSNKRRLRILMLCWEYPPNIVGGLSRHVHGLSVQLAKLGHEVHVLTAGNGSPSFEMEEGVYIHRIDPLNERDADFLSWIGGLNLAFAYKAEQLAEKIEFDIVHAHDWLVGASAIYLREALSLPLLSTIHATEHGRNNGIYTELQQFIHEKEGQLMKHSDQLIVCSKYIKEHLITIFREKEAKIVIIPNGIEPEKSEIDYYEAFPQLQGRKYVFSIGRIVKEKGFQTMIQAAQMAKEKQLDLFFVIAGKGPLLEGFRREISVRELEEYIDFIGYVSDEERNALIRGSEMAVFPSLYEPFGITALESMISGTPTIVSNTGGLKGLVRHLQTGWLMEPDDAGSLLSMVDFIKRHPKEAYEIGQNGLKAVQTLYGWKRIATETVMVMEDLILNMKMNLETIQQLQQ